MIVEAIETGKTTEEALDKACKKLGVDRLDAEYEVLETPSKGFLGMGGTLAKVRVYFDDGKKEPEKEIKKEKKTEEKPQKLQKAEKKAEKTKAEKPQKAEKTKKEDKAEIKVENKVANTVINNAESFLNEVLRLMDIKGAQVSSSEDDERISIEINGSQLGSIIGKRGDTLDALQYLCSLSANKGNKENNKRISLDVGGYRKKREETLEKLARSVAQKVISTKKSQALEPMQPYERRIIHSTLQNYNGVTTASIGEGSRRKVVVHYKAN